MACRWLVQHDDTFVASDCLSGMLASHLAPALERLTTAAQSELAAAEGSCLAQAGRSAGHLARPCCSLPGLAGIARSRAGSSMAGGGSSSSSSKERPVAEWSAQDTLQCGLMLAADVQKRRLTLLGVDACCLQQLQQAQQQGQQEQQAQGGGSEWAAVLAIVAG